MIRLALVIALAFPLLSQAADAPVIYVDASVTGPADGLSWCTAFSDLQDALALARSLGEAEIRVADGLYQPAPPGGDRLATFLVSGDISIRGGFAGCGAADPEKRDFTLFPTILSGDLNLDDDLTPCEEYSTCCITDYDAGCDHVECLDRLSPLVPSCESELPDWADCARFVRVLCRDLFNHVGDNSEHVVTVHGDDVVLDGLVVTGGWASKYPRGGDGGGIWHQDGHLTVRSCAIVHNTAVYGGGIHATWDTEALTLEHSEIAHNLAIVASGASVSTRGPVAISDSVFRDVRQGGGLVISNYSGADVVVRTTDFLRHSESPLVIFSHSGPSVRDCRFFDNQSGPMFDARPIHLSDCVFSGNEDIVNWSSLVADRLRFVGNTAVLFNWGSAIVRDTLVAGNDRNIVSRGYLELRNCTVVYNGNSVYLADENSTLVDHSILWLNTPKGLFAPREDLQLEVHHNSADPNDLEIRNSLVEGWSGRFGGTGNSGARPIFVDPFGSDDILGTPDDDYRPRPESPAVDGGAPGFVPEPGRAALDGAPRVLCGTVDIGAYESGFGDIDCDGRVSLEDIAQWAACLSGPTGPLLPGCDSLDANRDARFDQLDVAALLRAFDPTYPTLPITRVEAPRRSR